MRLSRDIRRRPYAFGLITFILVYLSAALYNCKYGDKQTRIGFSPDENNNNIPKAIINDDARGEGPGIHVSHFQPTSTLEHQKERRKEGPKGKILIEKNMGDPEKPADPKLDNSKPRRAIQTGDPKLLGKSKPRQANQTVFHNTKKTNITKKIDHRKDTIKGYARIGDFDILDDTDMFNRGQSAASVADAQQLFAKIVNTKTSKCKKTERWGRGGYGVCMDGKLKPNPKQCLIYGFGIGQSWAFEDNSRSYGCEVHSFDPSMGLEDHERSPGHFFHNIGLWGSDKVLEENGWALKSIETIVSELGHAERNIDVMKVDVENSEWSFLHHFVKTNIPERVKQLIFEIHSPIRSNKKLTIDTLRIMYNDMTTMMDKFGFQLIETTPISDCCGPRFGTLTPAGMLNMTADICCYELCYINVNLR